jgi:hypothetical protein
MNPDKPMSFKEYKQQKDNEKSTPQSISSIITTPIGLYTYNEHMIEYDDCEYGYRKYRKKKPTNLIPKKKKRKKNHKY